MLKKFFALSLLFTFVSLSAHADHRFVGSRKFAALIEKYQAACTTSPCQKPFREALLYKDGTDVASMLSASELATLKKVAFEQAQIWADTILEGDYVADGETRLMEVIGIFRSNELVAYKIRYAERAWDISTCDYDYENPETLQQCTEGFIRETSFVSPDFKNYVRNHDDIANFYN